MTNENKTSNHRFPLKSMDPLFYMVRYIFKKKIPKPPPVPPIPPIPLSLPFLLCSFFISIVTKSYIIFVIKKTPTNGLRLTSLASFPCVMCFSSLSPQASTYRNNVN